MTARILVIEDDPSSLELTRFLLASSGHQVAAAADGQAGLDAALRDAYDLILCDLQLPRLSGYGVLSRLKAHATWRPVPVVAVTAYSMPGDRAAVLAAGFAGYLTKPIDPETFLRDLEPFLPGARSEA